MEKNNSVVHSYFWQTSDFLAALAVTIGFAFETRYETTLGIPYTFLIGVFVWSTGLLVIFFTKKQFRKHKQKSGLGNAPDTLITDGIFGYSRNPIYLGMVVIVCGFGILFDSWWLIGSGLLAALFMQTILILPEEAFLQKMFPIEFGVYKKKVRRWI